ncbi:hypothetical protein J6500_08375 [Bradyrhizobium sp. WSM 1704]|uniref:hypothetical protein n=1 Tax=Bradyrhizobium semiaridum TaxID=2821404 RepID=UPI001CE37897|nr:hypothetical protein [Bradyrhizobium semiaridum]MCA6121914.1 hypothetical protein [Bradyrhizobium semiaridum]
MRILLLCLFLLSCVPAGAATDEIPNEMRGFWAGDKSTCNMLKSKGPASLNQGHRWLKITATDVLGSTQGRFFRELPIDSMSVPSTQLSIAIQTFGENGLMSELALTRDGKLIERIIQARGVSTYQKC